MVKFVDAVAVAPIHYFGVAGDNLDAGGTGRGCHGCDNDAQVVDGHSFFEDEAHAEIARLRAAHGEIIDRAVHGQIANIATGKEEWPHHKRIGAEG